MSASAGGRGDAAARILDWFIALMPAHRREWADAMRAELCHIGGRGTRWTFVLGCGWVACRTHALEGRGRLIIAACGGGALLVAPMVILSAASAGIAALWTLDAAVLFGMLWTLASTAVSMTGGLIASMRDPSRRDWLVMLRVAVLVLAAGGWFAIAGDQMPCFLGQPHCD